MYKYKRIDASLLRVEKRGYLLEDTPFTGVAYFLNNKELNGGYLLNNGKVERKFNDIGVCRDKKNWLNFSELRPYNYEAFLDASCDTRDIECVEPFTHNNELYTGIAVEFVDMKFAESIFKSVIIRSLFNGYICSEVEYSLGGDVLEFIHFHSTLFGNELFLSKSIFGGVGTVKYCIDKNGLNILRIKFNQDAKISSVDIRGNICIDEMKTIINEGYICRHLDFVNFALLKTVYYLVIKLVKRLFSLYFKWEKNSRNKFNLCALVC